MVTSAVGIALRAIAGDGEKFGDANGVGISKIGFNNLRAVCVYSCHLPMVREVASRPGVAKKKTTQYLVCNCIIEPLLLINGFSTHLDFHQNCGENPGFIRCSFI